MADLDRWRHGAAMARRRKGTVLPERLDLDVGRGKGGWPRVRGGLAQSPLRYDFDLEHHAQSLRCESRRTALPDGHHAQGSGPSRDPCTGELGSRFAALTAGADRASVTEAT